ncbi:MAG: hypothetical protein EPN85_09120 [Bacteroidetes bacterium]|nr:MAG: hypothetical protein EPN85_09120 [Bacteroidota bacterium]
MRLFLYLVFSACFSDAQNVRDSSLFIPMLKFSYAAYMPGGDLSDRFGVSSAIGIKFSIKTKKNLFLGVDGSFIFGNNIKEKGILDSLKTSTGFIIDQNGNPATVRLFERGFTASIHIGKLFRLLSNNKNSGLLIYGGPVYFQHKIRIDDIGGQSPQLVKGYKEGYDRLTAGFGFHEFAGYMYLGNNRILNFFGGFDFVQAITKSQRSYNYDLMNSDTDSRFDILSGIRFGWILPLYRSSPQQFYYH